MSEQLQLLKACLSSPGDAELLSRLHARAGEIVEYLDSEAGESEIEAIGLFDLPVANPEWVARVYEALGGSEPPPPASETQQREDEATEWAVEDFLSTSPLAVRRAFEELLELGLLVQQHMGKLPLFSVVDYAALEFGLLAESERSAGPALCYRTEDGLVWNPDLEALLTTGLREVVPDVNAEIIRALCQWLRVASENEPGLIPGFRSRVDASHLRFLPRTDVAGAIHSRRDSRLSPKGAKAERRTASFS